MGRPLDIRKMKSNHPFKVPTSPQLTALAFAFSELGHVSSAEDIFYTAYDKLMKSELSADELKQLEISGSLAELFCLNLLKVRCKITDMVAFAKTFIGGLHAVSAIVIKNDTSLTPEQFETEIKEGAVGPHILIAVYLPTVLHDAVGEVDTALVKHYNAQERMVTLSNANPTKYGVHTTLCSIDTLRQACTTPLHEPAGLLGLVRIGK
jgi:hypothetical protein